PTQPTSSSYDSAKCKGLLRGMARNSGTRASPAAIKPFMSQVPRPYNLPSRSVKANGFVSHCCPSTGTTSVWPDKTMPPWVLPSWAGNVANRLDLAPSGDLNNCTCTPCAINASRTCSIKFKLELRLVVSKATRVCSQLRVLGVDMNDALQCAWRHSAKLFNECTCPSPALAATAALQAQTASAAGQNLHFPG